MNIEWFEFGGQMDHGPTKLPLLDRFKRFINELVIKLLQERPQTLSQADLEYAQREEHNLYLRDAIRRITWIPRHVQPITVAKEKGTWEV